MQASQLIRDAIDELKTRSDLSENRPRLVTDLLKLADSLESLKEPAPNQPGIVAQVPGQTAGQKFPFMRVQDGDGGMSDMLVSPLNGIVILPEMVLQVFKEEEIGSMLTTLVTTLDTNCTLWARAIVARANAALEKMISQPPLDGQDGLKETETDAQEEAPEPRQVSENPRLILHP